MGCWNETCGITNLPIVLNDDIICLVIRHRVSCNRLHEFDDSWVPVGFPFRAKYDEYGGIKELKKSEYTDALFSYILSEVPKLSNRIKSLESFCGTYFNDNSLREFSVMYFHADAYDSLIEDEIDKEAVERIDKFINLLKRDDLSNDYLVFLKQNQINIITERFVSRFNDLVMQILTAQSEAGIVTCGGEICNFYKFKIAMSRLRRRLQPQSGLGRQDMSLDKYIALNKVTRKIINRLSKRYD